MRVREAYLLAGVVHTKDCELCEGLQSFNHRSKPRTSRISVLFIKGKVYSIWL